MASKDNRTVYQILNRIMTPSLKSNITSKKKYVVDDGLFKTNSIEDYNREKLERRQNIHLSNLWRRIENESYQRTIGYETTRIASYSDFENMEYYPEIATALDIFSDEATTTVNGKIINIFSDSRRIKDELTNLFENRLNLHVNLPMWARNLCKYGDNFVFLHLDREIGVVLPKQLPTFEIERRDGDLATAIKNQETDKQTTEFIWRGKDISMKPFQVAHFRLLTDDRRIPYGTSIIEKARQIWKKLMLAEDAMLVYRITRAPERRVFKVYVGNVDEEDVPAYIDEIANRFKRTPMVDPSTGQIDLRYNQLANDQDFVIPVRDENAPNPIETLQGANNINDIADIEFLQNKLLTTLRIPKEFLGFGQSVGDGKNLALMDIRFARAVNRIQQSLLLELNKIAVTHLILLGLDDEVDNFSLTLNNPSIQSQILQTELLTNKIALYKEAVSDAGNGFAPMSMTKARKIILEMSEDEIIQDLLEQRLEKAASEELANTAKVIKYTGLYDKVDRIYGDIDVAINGGGDDTSEDLDSESTPSGGGGSTVDLSSVGAVSDEELGVDTPKEGEDLDNVDVSNDANSDETLNENFSSKRLVIEERSRKSKLYQTKYLEHLNVYLKKKSQPNIKSTILENVNLENDKMLAYLKEIDNFKD